MTIQIPFLPVTSNPMIRRVLIIALLCTAALALVAWQITVAYVHGSRYGGEAEGGNHRGQVELSGGNRYVRAGDDYVYWTTPQVWWMNAHMVNGRKPAMAYHAFAQNSNNCGGIRITYLPWSWSNLPSVTYVSKRAGCFFGNNNEWRAVMGTVPTAGTYYYFQHLFEDTNYPGSNSEGEVTVDSYWHYSCAGTYCSEYNDYHGKFCINTTNVAYAPDSAGEC